jgi:hypothetical protein
MLKELMPNPQSTPTVSRAREGPGVLRPDPRWFLTRGLAWGLALPLILGAVGARRSGLLVAIGVAVLWLLFRNSYMTLDSRGFTYHSVVRRISHAWVDVERFSVVEQRIYFFVPVSQYVGWNYSPAYRNYKRLAIPRTIARWVGMTDAMFKPVGFNVPELTRVLNEHLSRARSADIEQPSSVSRG